MKTISLNRILPVLITVFFAAFVFTSCQKEASSGSSNSITEAEAADLSDETTQAEANLDDANELAFTAAEEDGNAGGFGVEGVAGITAGRRYLPGFLELRERIGDCATITVTPNDSTYPKTITIDFGDSCRGRDGRVRSGKMIINFTGPIRRPGSVVTLSFDNFYVNRVHIEGTTTFSNLSVPPQHKWSITVAGGRVTFPNGRGYSYEGSKTVTQMEGMLTGQCRDDVYEITTRSRTEFNSGKIVTITTEEPLVKKAACHWISAGKLKITVNDRILFLDFAFPNNGACDNKALLTWNSGANQRVINLP